MLGPLERGNSQVRVAAAEAMAYLRNGNALVPLAEAALLDDVEAVRTAAAISMGVLDSERAVQLVLPFLEDARGNIRLAAVEALANIGNEAAAEHLPDLAVFDEDPGVRRAAAETISLLRPDWLPEQILQALDDEDGNARLAAVEALEVIGIEAAAEHLPDLVLFDEVSDIRKVAARAIGTLRPDWLPEQIVQALDDDEAELRRAAVEAMRLIGNVEAVGFLLDVALFDEHDDIRELTVSAMSELDPEMTMSLLLGSLASISPDEREAAAKALGFVFDGTVVDDLVQVLLYDEVEAVRSQASTTLLEHASERAFGHMVDALDDQDPLIRDAATRALEELFYNSLLRRTSFQRTYWPNFSLDPETLAILDSDRVMELLLEILGESDQLVKANAVRALGHMGDSSVVESLLNAFGEGNEHVRDVVKEALDNLGGWFTDLETGAILASLDDDKIGFGPATTARRSPQRARIPVLRVSGSTNTRYLRTATGDVYENGGWLQLDPLSFPLGANQHIAQAVQSLLADYGKNSADLSPERLNAALVGGYNVTPAAVALDQIVVSSAGTGLLTRGVAPISLNASEADQPGQYRPFSATLVLDGPAISYKWVSKVPRFTEAQLSGALAATDPTYLQLPEGLRAEVKSLADRITRQYSSPYQKARAIERHLENNYLFFYEGGDQWEVTPFGRDPILWFLFDKKHGTSPTFSSAFVVLARAAGIPARVVSGWVVAQTSETQTVYSDQAHQWAEVAFDGLGWVTFDPTPPSRSALSRAGALEGVDGNEDSGLSEQNASRLLESDDAETRAYAARALGESGNDKHVESLASALADSEVSVRNSARGALERLGATVHTLENGASLVLHKNKGYSAGGVSTGQVAGLVANPIFEVTGAANTGYLRVTTGEVYRDGQWLSLYPVELPSAANARVPQIVTSALQQPDGPFSLIPDDRLDLSLVGQFETTPYNTVADRIRITPIGNLRAIPGGPIPVSKNLQAINIQGRFFPFSGTYSSDSSIAQYSWTSRILQYSLSQLSGARTVSDPTYTQLPADLPARIRELALTITRNRVGPYEKAKAIEAYLKTTYPYRFADSQDDFPPPGRDPVDWFLFDHPEGTCSVFSSAFVVLARSVGIPARVVSGWAIGRNPGTQTVYTDQAHQWAEVAFEGLGWVLFEPTGSADGPLARIRADSPLGPVHTT